MKSGAKSISDKATGTTVSTQLPASVIVADDLSGACDAGVQFACDGLSTRVVFGPSARQSQSQVHVISTNSRRDPAAAAVRQIEQLAFSLPRSRRTLYFKKIDSTLRGHIGAECEAMMRAFDCSYAVVAPAYPGQGRRVTKGVLKFHTSAGEQACDALELLRKQTLRPVAHIETAGFGRGTVLPDEIASQRAAGARFILCDAVSVEDLQRIAQAIDVQSEKPLWVGSAGLAEHAAGILAATLRITKKKTAGGQKPGKRRPVFICVGSDHPATLEQTRVLRDANAVHALELASASPAQVRTALHCGKDLLLSLDTEKPDLGKLRNLICEATNSGVSGVVVTGGDTATLLCSAAGTDAIRLEDEFATGIPWGYLEGGLLEGLPVVTKSGGFGNRTALLQAVEFLGTLAAHAGDVNN